MELVAEDFFPMSGVSWAPHLVENRGKDDFKGVSTVLATESSSFDVCNLPPVFSQPCLNSADFKSQLKSHLFTSAVGPAVNKSQSICVWVCVWGVCVGCVCVCDRVCGCVGGGCV